MSIMSKPFIFVVLLCFSSLTWAENYDESVYSQTIHYASKYHEEIQDIIITAMAEREWSVKSQSPGEITAWLEDYKGYQVIVDISYGDSIIDIKYVNFKKLNCRHCKKSRSKKYYLTWRLNLRSTINKKLHNLSMQAHLDNPETLSLWLTKIRTGTHQEKLKIGRYIYELSLFEPQALAVLAEEIEANYLKNLSKHDIQVYAFYCKSLASTADDKYKQLLTKVMQGAKAIALRKYVKGYLNNYYDSV